MIDTNQRQENRNDNEF